MWRRSVDGFIGRSCLKLDIRVLRIASGGDNLDKGFPRDPVGLLTPGKRRSLPECGAAAEQRERE